MSRREPATPGGHVLRAWLDANKLNIATFAEKFGIERTTLQRVMSGERRRMSVDLAIRIQSATDGAVPVEVWSTVAPAPRSGPDLASADDSAPHSALNAEGEIERKAAG